MRTYNMTSYYPTAFDRLAGTGVPPALRCCELESSQEGHVVLQWLKGGGIESLKRGENWYFETITIESVDMLPLFIKWLAVHTRVPVFFARSGQLAKLLAAHDYKKFEVIASATVLAIGDFYEPSRSRRECGMTATQRGHIETMLLERKDRRKPTVFQIHNPHHLLHNHTTWWRASVLDQLQPKRLKISISD
jgi:hypothetical protein